MVGLNTNYNLPLMRYRKLFLNSCISLILILTPYLPAIYIIPFPIESFDSDSTNYLFFLLLITYLILTHD
jgi:hypothetical protein